MIWLWIGFVAAVVGLLVVDLTLLHRKSERVSTKSALKWVGVFVGLALAFNVAVYFIYQHDVLGFGTKFAERARAAEAAEMVSLGKLSKEEAAAWKPPRGTAAAEAVESPGMTAAQQYLAGWLTEYSLSVDNIFVIALIFTHFSVPLAMQRRVLFWGILGALVMRGGMILGGAKLIEHFNWILYVFGAFLIYTAFKLAFSKEGDDGDELENAWYVRGVRKLLPLSPRFDGDRFTTRLEDGRLAATPLLLVLVIVEITDVVFAVDSIPAIFGITTDPFLVFTSNVFAILGLRSLFFALSGLMDKFHYLKYSLAAILGFVGLKMLAEMPAVDVHVPTAWSLGVIVGALALGIGASLLYARRRPAAPEEGTAPDAPPGA
jgi:tellurite resistance protein TerC